MAYKKLSQQVQELTNPQRSDTFIKLFQEAIRQGRLNGAYLPERFTMPKQFGRRGTEETYQRDTREMLFEETPEFTEWFEGINRELAGSRKGGSVKPSLEAIEAGLINFEDMVNETRRKMQASYEKGQALGKSRAKAVKTVKGSRSRKK